MCLFLNKGSTSNILFFVACRAASRSPVASTSSPYLSQSPTRHLISSLGAAGVSFWAWAPIFPASETWSSITIVAFLKAAIAAFAASLTLSEPPAPAGRAVTSFSGSPGLCTGAPVQTPAVQTQSVLLFCSASCVQEMP